jgi:hypothetical protein
MIGERSADYLTTGSIIRCTHGGVLKILDVEILCEILSASILTTQTVLGGSFVGCSQVGPGIKPCLKIVQILKGVSPMFRVSGVATVTNELDFITDGSPPGQRLIEAVQE